MEFLLPSKKRVQNCALSNKNDSSNQGDFFPLNLIYEQGWLKLS